MQIYQSDGIFSSALFFSHYIYICFSFYLFGFLSGRFGVIRRKEKVRRARFFGKENFKLFTSFLYLSPRHLSLSLSHSLYLYLSVSVCDLLASLHPISRFSKHLIVDFRLLVEINCFSYLTHVHAHKSIYTHGIRYKKSKEY